MSELFEMSRAAIESAGVQNRLAGGVILTGGGALLPGATDLAQQIFDLPVRLGTPIELSGWSDKVDTPQFATGVGLLRFALRQPGTMGNPLATASNPQLAPSLADPARRVWGVRAPGTPATESFLNTEPETGETAIPSTEVPVTPVTPQIGNRIPTQTTLTPAAPSPEESAAETEHRTPFDRMRRDRDQRQARKATSVSDNAGETQSFWQRLITGVRQFLGFETV